MKPMTTGLFAMAMALALVQPVRAQDDTSAVSRVDVTLGDYAQMREVKHLHGAQ